MFPPGLCCTEPLRTQWISADLGSVLQQSSLNWLYGSLERTFTIKSMEVAVHTAEQNKMKIHFVIYPTLDLLGHDIMGCLNGLFLSKALCLQGYVLLFSKRLFQD